MKQKFIIPEQPPAYSETPDYSISHISYSPHYQPTASYPMVPTNGYQHVTTNYVTAGTSQTSNMTAAVTTVSKKKFNLRKKGRKEGRN